MLYALTILVFILGLSVGSFVNAYEYRIREKKSIHGRSFCPHCKHQLAWYDLFPLFSFALLGGKCRYCGKKISWQYPIVELLTGVGFVGVFAKYFWIPVGVYPELVEWTGMTVRSMIGLLLLLFIVFVAVLVGLHDYKTTYILSKWVYLGALAAVILAVVNYQDVFSWQPLFTYFSPFLLSAFIPGLLFYSLYFFSKGRWMGEGEYELAILIGLTLGFPLVLPAYYFAFITGSVVGLLLVYAARKKQMDSAIPFGPFLMSGLVFSLIFGQQIVNLYARIFLGL